MSIKIAHKSFLLLAIPLILELGFLCALISSLHQAEDDMEMLANAGNALVYVNLVLYDAATAATQMLTGRFVNNSRLSANFNQLACRLQMHRDELRNFASSTKNAGERDDLNSFVALVDGFTDMFSNAREAYDAGGFMSITRTAGKLRSFITRINVAGNEIVQKQVTARDAFLQKRKNDYQQLQEIIEIFTALLLLVTAILCVLLSLTFSRRLQLMVKNTESIAMDKPLAPRLQGNDELSLLDEVIHNLSEELALSRQKERAMLDNTAEVILSLDQQLRVTQINSAVFKVLGIEDKDFLGTAIQSFVHEQDRDATFKALDDCKSGSADTAFESRLKRFDGKYLHVLWNVHWSKTNQSYFCILHDFTERKEAERLKEEVLAMVSHDLRSPLSNLQVSIELIGTGKFGTLNEQGARLARNAEQSVGALIEMINDLLEVERMQGGGFKLDMEPTQLQPIADQAAQMLEEQAAKKHVKLECNCGDLIVSMDGERMRRVFVNLISNAIKYSPVQSTVRISAEKSADIVEIKVEDEGAGIPSEHLQTIFEKFKQASKRDELTGTGLGLAICKAIVEAHGGSIGVDSKVGEGSSFWIRLPAQS